MKVLRGEVWWIDFDPSIGSEIQKLRPAVVVSNDRSNDKLERYQVLPLSTQVTKIYPTEVLIRFKNKASKAMADQLTTVSRKRMKNRAGSLDQQTMDTIDAAIMRQLDLTSKRKP